MELLNSNPKSLNTTLKRRDQIKEYITLCEESGLVHRHDPPKNWDNFKAVHRVLSHHPNRNARILDAGGIQASAFLPSLCANGYQRLVALDLTNPEPPRVDGAITYKRGDITKTAYLDSSFDAIGCLSVIEHGVDATLFFKEMSRLLKTGGSLIVSTDYWKEKIINSDGRKAYGVPVHIFSESEIRDVVNIADQYGLHLTDKDVDYKCDEKTIDWMGFQYTFIILCFEKRG